jgi:hypothetical protein
MSTFPRSPRVVRGAIVGVDILKPIPTVIIFQYNPENLTRTLKPRAPAPEGARSEAMRLGGPPEEEIKVDVEIDATDQLEQGDAIAGTLGLHPRLAALEMLVYPQSPLVIANTALLAAGTIEVIPPVGPFTLLIWGAKRILPVRLTEISITEESHDINLNPLRAKVSLGLRVLSYADLSITHPGYYVFLAHQVVKEALATIGVVNDLSAVGAGSVKLF